MTNTEYGTLTDHTTGEQIRPATAVEHARSLAAGETGAFDLDGRVVFVAGGPEEPTTFTAAIATASDVVAGDFCDVSVIENEIVGYDEADVDEFVPEYGMTDKVAMDAVETDVRTDDDDKLAKAADAADVILTKNGWSRVDDWSFGDNAMYAIVEPADA